MADSTSIEQPFPIFFDKVGKPLDSGYVYIGEYGKNPQTNPIQTFWDEALTQPAVQPIRTINGYYSRYGTPSRVFIQGLACSITVRDKYQTVVYSDLKTSGKVAGLINASVILDNSGLNQQQINDKSVTTVDSIADLTSISNPKNGQVVFVKSIEKNYTYTPSTTEAENGVTVVGEWIMEIPSAYYASWFAIKDVATDQSLKLQTGHDYATLKDRPFIVDYPYHVEANQNYLGIENNAFIVRDNSKITFLPNADFIQINQNKNQSNIILLMRTKNATLIRPKTTGDRLENTAVPHNSDAQGFGYGMTLYEPENCFIFEPNCSQNNGDNIYIGKPWGSNQDILPKNITIVRPICHHTRRNCISLTSWDNVKIIDPIMSYAGDSDGITGAFPKSCMDIELENAPGFPPANGYNGVVTNPKCFNANNGLFFYSSYDDRSFDIHIQGDLMLNGISTIGLGLFHGSRNNIGLVKIDNVRYLSNMFQEIVLAWNQDSKLKVEIDNVYPLDGDNSFEIASLINGDFLTKTLGNVTINNLHTTGFTPFIVDVGVEYTVDGYKFYVAKNAKNGITYYTNNPSIQAKTWGANTYIESVDSFTHSGFSASTIRMPNEIWQTPPDPTTAVYLNTTEDLRVLKIGLKYDGIVGNGCNINGINILVDGVAKTQARTATLGGWIKFQNISGGRTRIFDQYGVWTFS